MQSSSDKGVVALDDSFVDTSVLAMEPPVAPPGNSTEIGDKARAGSVWIIGASAAAKLLGFLCQFALAWFISKKEFGIFAIAISLSVVLSILRDGGLPMVLIEKGRRFNLFAGPVFWMMLAINTATGLVILAVAIPAARFYGEPELAIVIALFAATVPMCVPASLLGLRMTVDMRFRELAVVQVVSAVVRNTLLLVFAHAGYGARSLILPLLITNVSDGIFLWYFTRFSPWTMRPRFKLWRGLFRSGRWVFLGTFSIALGNNGPYLALGKILPSEVVGTYFFAYQIVVQLGTLLSDNVYQVLFATFVRMRGDTARIRSAATRSLQVVVWVGAAVSLAIAAVFRPLEQGLWHGKWAAATNAIQVLAFIWPAAAAASVLRALQAAAGHFQEWGAVALVTAVASVAGTVMGALLAHSATGAALGFGAGSLIGAVINARVTLLPLGIDAGATAHAVLRPWLAIAVAAVVAEALGHRELGALRDFAITAGCFCVAALTMSKLLAAESLHLAAHSVGQIFSRKFALKPPVVTDT
jgi:PST family polysaccharide transporter